jgi:hypothetical protein
MLRVSVAASLHLNAAGYLVINRDTLLFAMLVVLSASVTAGLLTPVAALLGAIIELVILFRDAANLVAAALLGPLSAIVLSLLGPGAYSVDAQLFGRRVLVLHSTDRR